MEECGKKAGGNKLLHPQLLGSNPGSASWLYVQIQGTFALINKSKIIMFICVVAVMTQTRYSHVSTSYSGNLPNDPLVTSTMCEKAVLDLSESVVLGGSQTHAGSQM